MPSLSDRAPLSVPQRVSRAIALTLSITLATAGLAASLAPATPAQAAPGVPSPPSLVYFENFENAGGTVTLPLTSYVGSAAALGATYTADPIYRNTANVCNGSVLSASRTVNTTPGNGDTCLSTGGFYTVLQRVARALGQFEGESAAAALGNDALAGLTGPAAGTPFAGVMFSTTSNSIPTIPGHYYNVNADLAAVTYDGQSTGAGCATFGAGTGGDPRLTFSLLNGATPIVLSTNLNPCTAPGAANFTVDGTIAIVAQLSSAALQWPETGASTMGIQLSNATASGGNGNDAALDNVQVVDVTPQLDKTFSPPLITAGQTTTLTFTITNTNELNAKAGWDFLDNLPTGVTATGVNSTTCSAGTITAPAGSTSVVVSNGTIGQGVTSCTVSVQVTSTVLGSHVNGPANFPAGLAGLSGLLPPSDATLIVIAPETLTIAKSSTTNAITTVGQKVPYSFQLVNRSDVTLTSISVTDNQTAPSLNSGLSNIVCPTTTLTPGSSATCSAIYTVTQADLNNGSITDTATATGTNPSNAQVTTLPSSLTIRTPTAAVSVVKSSTTTLVSTIGQVVPYEFEVTNTGNVPVTGLTINDAVTAPSTQGNLSAVTCPTAPLAVGASATCTANYTATEADLINGTVSNTATASATGPSSTVVTSAPSSVVIESSYSAVPQIVKSSTTQAITAVGQVVPYSFEVTNNGVVPLTSVTVVDTQLPPGTQANLSPISCPSTSLAVGETMTCTATYTVSRTDMNNGQIQDSAIARGTNPSNEVLTSAPSTLAIATPTPALTVVKSTTTRNVNADGQVVPYTFEVTNSGNLTMNSVTVTDTVSAPSTQANLSAISCPVTTLAPGASMTCTATYTTTTADMGSSSVNDFATANGTSTTSVNVTSPASYASIPVATSALTLVKSTTTESVTSIGQEIEYSFAVHNTSSVIETNLVINDVVSAPSTQANLSAVTCLATTLAADESTTCTATYTTTQADLDNGSVNNSATAEVTIGGSQSFSGVSSTTVAVTADAALTILKSSSTTEVTAAGVAIPYSFLVTNTGSLTVSGLTVADTIAAPATPANLTAPVCPQTTLAAGESTTCTATYTPTQADLNFGSVSNSATATATPLATSLNPAPAALTSPASDLVIPVDVSAELTVLKSSTTTEVTAVGQVIPYSFEVTNSGNVTMNTVFVTDTVTAPSTQANLVANACPVTTLAPGASTTCTATYTTTQADLDNGSVNDSATATGTPPATAATPSPAPVVSVASAASILVNVPAGLTVVKSSTTTSFTAAGQTVPYSFAVTNTGELTLTAITITDTMQAPATQANLSAITCLATTLAPSATTTCTGSYTTTQADVDNGSIDNSATASGTPPATTANPTPSPISSAAQLLSIPATVTATLILDKSVSPTTVVLVGAIVTYSFLITNTGNVTLTDVAPTETAFSGAAPLSITCPGAPVTLAPAASVTCTASYTVDQDDVDAGTVTNTATASGTSPSSAIATSAPDSATVTITRTPALTLAKSVSPTTAAVAGTLLTYSFLVTNSGNVTVTNVQPVETAFSGSGPALAILCPAAANSLAPAATVTCTAQYLVTQTDVESGSITNTATAGGQSPTGAAVTSAPSAATVAIPSAAALSLVKSVSPSDTASFVLGAELTFSFVMTNTGNQSLTNVHVIEGAFTGTGSMSAIDCTGAPTTLAPQDQAICTSTYTVTQDDVDASGISNTATAAGTPPSGPDVVSNASEAVSPADQEPAISVTKTADVVTVDAVGDTIEYSFLVTNSGNVTLTDVQPVEGTFTGSGALGAIVCPPSTTAVTPSLVPGESVTCTASYTVTQTDIDAGAISNTASATGAAPAIFPGPDPVAADSTSDVSVVRSVAYTIVKTADVPRVRTAGTVITYSFLVTNTGNVTLLNVNVVEGTFTGSGTAPVPTCPAGAASLAPGDSLTCTATYTVVAADLQPGSQLSNTATATADTAAISLRTLSLPSESTALVAIETLPAIAGLLAFSGIAGGPLLLGALLALLVGGMLLLSTALRRRPRYLGT